MKHFLMAFSFFTIIASCGKKKSDTVAEKQPALSISDISQVRNSSATSEFEFVVSVDRLYSKDITVAYTTADGTANSHDYTPKAGTLTIPANKRSATIMVEVRGDSLREAGKTFFVQLSNPVNATLSATAKGTGTILCEDGTYLPVDGDGYTAPASYAGMSLVWSDEFNGSALENNTWNYETGGNGWGNNELQNYTQSPKNVFLTGGYLVLEARKETVGGNNYTSGRLQTLGKKSFKYGRMDIRAKLPKGKGVWPAIWMLGSNINTTPWPACGEIDIMELLGHEPAKSYGTMHWGNIGGASSQMGGPYVLPSEDFSQKFHLFSIVWDSEKIEWYVDNVKFFTGNKSAISGNDPFDKEFFFVLNLAVGGNWPSAPDITTVFPQRMIVDYIRVYQ